MVLSAYLVGAGIARFLIDSARENTPAQLGLTQPQLWSVVLAAAGVVLAVQSRRRDPHLVMS